MRVIGWLVGWMDRWVIGYIHTYIGEVILCIYLSHFIQLSTAKYITFQIICVIAIYVHGQDNMGKSLFPLKEIQPIQFLIFNA